MFESYQRVNFSSHCKEEQLYLRVVTDVNQTCYGGHFAIFIYFGLLYCTPETNMSIISQFFKNEKIVVQRLDDFLCSKMDKL